MKRRSCKTAFSLSVNFMSAGIFSWINYYNHYSIETKR